jgi:hypothetical protein
MNLGITGSHRSRLLYLVVMWAEKRFIRSIGTFSCQLVKNL